MPISYVGGVSGNHNGSTTVGITLSLTALAGGSDSAPVAGDVVFITVCKGALASSAPSLTTGGYTQILSSLYSNGSSYDTNLAFWYKVMGSTPDTSVVVAPSGSTARAIAAAVQVWRGVDASIFDVASQSATGTATQRPTPPAITPSTLGAVILCAGGGSIATGAVYTTSDLTSLVTNTGADNQDADIGLAYKAWTSGTFTPAAWGGGGTVAAGNSWAAYTIALLPAASGGTEYPKTVGGALSFAGVLPRQPSRGASGVLSFAGVLPRQPSRGASGVLSFAGALATARIKMMLLAGTLSFAAGGLARSTARHAAGSLAAGGTLRRTINRSFLGSLVLSSGLLGRVGSKAVNGSLPLAGVIQRISARYASGALGFSSVLGAAIAGAVNLYEQAVGGALALSGSVTKTMQRSVSGVLDFIGDSLASLVAMLVRIRRFGSAISTSLSFSSTLHKKSTVEPPTTISTDVAVDSAVMDTATGASTVATEVGLDSIIHHVESTGGTP